MKIAIFTDYFYPELGGMQDSVAELSRELGARGHTVHIWAPKASKKDFRISGLQPVELDLGKNVHVHRVPSIHCPSSSLQSRIAMPYVLPAREVLRTCDVLHTHSFIGIGLSAIRAASRYHIPLVGTNHWVISEFAEYAPAFLEGTFRRGSVKLVTWYYNHCAYVTAPSQTVLDEKITVGMRQRSAVVSNPIDVKIFRPAHGDERATARKKFGFDGLVIACVGRLAPEKKNDIAVRAFARTARRFPDAILAFGGHGSFEKDLRALAEKEGVASRVRFLGTLTKEGVAELYRASDVYAITSTSESQSMSLIQAFATGLPAVGVSWRAIPEYLNADRGFLSDRDDVEAFSRHLETLLGDEELRKRLGQNALAFAQNLSVKAVVDTWERIYGEVCASHAKKPPQKGLF